MDKAQRIAIVRESITKIAQILSDGKVLVTQAGVKAFVNYDKNTMKATRVNLPMLPDDASDELIEAVQGFLDSEIGKVLYADGKSNLRAAHENMSGLYNPLESFFCEKEMVKNFAGSRHNLAHMHQTFVDKFIEPKLKEAIANGADEQELFQVLAIPALRAWGGQQFFIDYMSTKWSLIAGIQSQLDPIASKMKGMTKATDCYEMAKEIRDVVMGKPPEGDGENPYGDPNPNPGPGTTGGGGGKGKGDKGKSDGKKGNGGGGAGDLDLDEDEEEEGEGADEDDEAEEEGADDDDDDGTVDNGDDSAPEESEGGEAGDSQSKQNERPPETEDTATTQAEYGGADYMANFDWNKLQDISDEFGQYVTDLCSTETDAEDYTVFSRDWDILDTVPVPDKFDPKWLQDMEDAIAGMVGPVSRQLERAFAARNKSLTQQGQRKGKMSSSNLYRLTAGDDRIFSKTIEHKTRDVVVSLVVDCSGSMHGSKIHTAMCAAWVMADVLQRLGVECEVMGFTTGDLSSPLARQLYDEMRDGFANGKEWDRTAPLRLPMFKKFGEKFGIPQKQRMSVYARVQGAMGSNVDGESVQYAYESLNRQANKGGKKKGRMMIVFSDGQPAGGGVRGDKLNAHLKAVVKRIEADGVNIVGVGIQTDCVQAFYRKNVALDKIDELPGIVLNQLRDALLSA